jgi:hypothetical protein
MKLIKKLFPKKEKKKTYVAENPDWTTFGFWIVMLSFASYFIVRAVLNKTIALPFLMAFPALIGVFVILYMLPFRAITFAITLIVLGLHLRKIPRDQPLETVVIVGKNDYWRPSFWAAPNYDTDFLILIRYLKLKGSPFAIYENVTIEKFDEIMENTNIKTVYIVGHGRRHGYGLDSKIIVDYCRYKDDAKYRKDFVYQIHCNHGSGTSLVEYVVPREHQAGCLPEHGFMSNTTINQMFIDKIIAHQKYVGWKAKIVEWWYKAITAIIPLIVMFGWGYVFFKLVT